MQPSHIPSLHFANMLFTTTLACVALSCGGKQKSQAQANPASDLDEPTLGATDHSPDEASAGTDLNEQDEQDEGEGGDSGTASGTAEVGGSSTTAPTGPAVTFEIKNSFNKDLVFNLDAGWAAGILVFSGTPPHAVSILPFAKHCTAACDADASKRCPVCKEPSSIGAIRKAEKRELVAAGATHEVIWDTAEVYTYKKTKAKGRQCDCYQMDPVPDGQYTVRACGLRLSQKHRQKSVFQCVTVENAVTFPADGPQRVILDFGNPKKKSK